mgnify:CR=1 FL=1
MRLIIIPKDRAEFVYGGVVGRQVRRGRDSISLRGADWDEELRVRDAEGRHQGGFRLAERGETEGAPAPEPRSQPDPERSEGARPKRNLQWDADTSQRAIASRKVDNREANSEVRPSQKPPNP